MEDQTTLNKAFNTYGELRESAQIYCDCINIDNIKFLESPSLKYALYNLNLFEAFQKRIKSISIDVEKLKKRLKNYKGTKVNPIEEMKALDEILNKLLAIKKEANEEYDFYKVYLVKIAKKFDTLKNDNSKRVYIKSSEDIIISKIKYYLNYEKNFLYFNDIIKQLSANF